MTMHVKHSEENDDTCSNLLRVLLTVVDESVGWGKIMAKGPHGLSQKNRTLNLGNDHENEKEM